MMQEDSCYSRTEEIAERARDIRENVSPAEEKFWPRVCRDRMGAPFRKQHPIGPYVAGYCCVPLKLVVEIDGPLRDRRSDAARDRFLAACGYHVLRFSVQELDGNFRGVLQTIRDRVQLRLAEKREARARGKNRSP